MCGDLGHFSKSTLCKGKAKGLRKVQEEDSSEEDVTRLKEETVAGVTKVGEPDTRIRVSLGVAKQGDSFRGVKIEVLADTGVRRTILNIGDWEKLGGGELKKTKLRFRPYGTNQYLPIRGRAAVSLTAEAGAMIETEVYVNQDRSEESLLGEKGAERLGIVTVRPEGAARKVEIRRVKQNSKAGLEKVDQTVMRDLKVVDAQMEKVAEDFKEGFEGIGKYKWPPVKIQGKEGVSRWSKPGP